MAHPPPTPVQDARGLKIALITSRFNEQITLRLRDGAHRALTQHGAQPADITEVWVPGAWELPLTARELIQTGKFDAIVCLGCVIRGETTHHIHVGGEAARGIADLSLQTGVPIGFGVLTTDTEEQALARSADSDNKGADAALAAVEMVHALRRIKAL
jgi:6,7-dimethyl-8-ribityllumazine synthase